METVSTPRVFKSFDAVQKLHQKFLKANSGSETVDSKGIRQFIDEVEASGTYISSDRQRTALQTMIDYWSATLQRQRESVKPVQPKPFDLNRAPVLPDSACPFPGLRSFTEADFELYFGRERLVDEALERLESQGRGGCLLLTGESGCGKTSLLRAGILPRLTRQTGREFLRIDCRQVDLVTELSGPEASPRRPGMPAPNLGDRIVAIDHFEHFLRATSENADVRRLAGALLAELMATTKLIFVLQSGAEALLAGFPDLQKTLQNFRLSVPALTPSESREIITKPAEKAGLCFEDRLVEWLVQDTVGIPDGLPEIACTLRLLWSSRDHNQIRFSDYESIEWQGVRGVPAAIRFAAEHSIERLSETAVKSVLLRMIRMSDFSIETWGVDERELNDQSAVVSVLHSAGLLTRTGGILTVAHASLGRRWPRLRSWLNENRAVQNVWWDAEARRRTWLSSGKPAALLLKGEGLNSASTLLESEQQLPFPLSQEMRTFIDLSGRRAAKARFLRRGAWVAAGFVVLVLVIAVGSYAWWLAHLEAAEDSVATTLEEITSGWRWAHRMPLVREDPVWRAYETDRPNNWYPNLADSDPTKLGYGAILALTVAGSGAQRIAVFGTKGPEMQGRGNGPGVIRAWWPDDEWNRREEAEPIFVEGDVRTVAVWKDPQQPAGNDFVIAAGTSTGRLILAEAHRVEDTTGEPFVRQKLTRSKEIAIFDGPVRDVVFSDDGQRLLLIGPEKMSVVDRSSLEQRELSTPERVDFAGGVFLGDSVVGAARDGRIYRWQTWRNNRISAPSDGRIGPLTSIALSRYEFSPLGERRTLLAVSGTGTAIAIYDADKLELLDTVSAPSKALVSRVQFGNGGETLLLGTVDGIWIFDRAARDFRLVKDSEDVVTFAASGSELLTGSSTGRIKIWPSSGIEPLAGGKTSLWNLSTSIDPGGELISVGGFRPNGLGDFVQLWQYKGGKFTRKADVEVSPPETPENSRGGDGRIPGVFSVAMSANSLLAAGNSWGQVRLWKLNKESPQIQNSGEILPTAISLPENRFRRIWSLAFSGDGSELLAGDDCGRFELFKFLKGKWISSLSGNHFGGSVPIADPVRECGLERSIIGVQLVSDLIVTAASDTVRVWRMEGGNPLGKPWCEYQSDSSLIAMSISGDSGSVAIGDKDGHFGTLAISRCRLAYRALDRDDQKIAGLSSAGPRLWVLSNGRLSLYGVGRRRASLKGALPGGTALAASESRIAVATRERILVYPGSADSIATDLIGNLRASDRLPSGLKNLSIDEAFTDSLKSASRKIEQIERDMSAFRSYPSGSAAPGLDKVLKEFDEINRKYPWKDVPAVDWNNLCWRVSVSDLLDPDLRVLAACYAAVATEPASGYRDSLALALARRASNTLEWSEAVRQYWLAASAFDYIDPSRGAALYRMFDHWAKSSAPVWQERPFNDRDFLRSVR
jgi:WD40 repeat protein